MTNYKQVLPKYFSISADGVLLYQASETNAPLQVGNFFPLIIDRRISVNSQNRNTHWITFRLVIDGQHTEENWTVPYLSLDKYDYAAKADVRCNSALPPAKLNFYIKQIVNFQMKNLTKEPTPYYNGLGWTTFCGEPAFLLGDKLVTKDGIVPEDQYMAADSLKEFHFDIDGIPLKNAVEDVIKIIRVDEQITPILIANVFVSTIRTLFVDAGFAPQYIVYLVAPSQRGKTTLAKLTSSLFNRNTNDQFALSNLISTNVSMQSKVSLFRDTTYILDDLFPDPGSSSARSREKTFIELVRIIGNNKMREKQCGKETMGYSPNAGVVATGEYLVKSLSTLARCIILHVDNELNKPVLNDLNQRPLSLPTVVYHYIQWCAVHYDELITFIREENKKYRHLMECVHTSYARVHENYSFVKIGMSLFLEFCKDNQAISTEEENDLISLFKKACMTALQRQKTDMNGLKETSNLVDAIAINILNQRFALAHKSEYIPDNYDGIIRESTICFDPEKLKSILKNSLGIQKVSTQSINKQLMENGLLDTDCSASNTKKVFEKRMIVINRQRIVNYIETIKIDYSK